MSGPAPSGTPLLDRIDSPADLRRLAEGDLPALAAELRREMIDAVSATGGHLGAGLGVVELTIALHHVFDTPRDRLIWDVGHQAYPHKMLTGRRGRIRTLRQKGGLSGFTRRAESGYDPFGTAHAATSVSAALGMAVAADLRGEARRAVAVIGDGAMTAGMAYEALNHAGSTDLPLVVVLNDNNMSIAPPTGAMSAYLARLISSRQVRRLRARARRINDRLPRGLADLVRRADRSARALLVGGTLFDELGFYYIGPVDGHRFDRLLPILKAVRDMPEGRPVLVHAVTRKGCGYPPAEESEDKFHGVSRFDVVTGRPTAKPAAGPSYSAVFGDTLRRLARGDPRIAAVTAAMPGGTGLDRFADEHPERCFDVGIAEQHAVTFAAGLAAEGMRPFVAIYSTFLQRALDQVIHDVAVQGLPVRFAIDRAGLVGADGPTHAGSFDTAFLANLPGFVVMAAADEAELARMLATQQGLDGRPSAVRYPRGTGPGAEVPEAPAPLEVGRGRVLREGSAVALLSYGARLGACLGAADLLAARGLPCTVADARFCKPLDEELALGLADSHDVLLTVEEGAVGGFGSHVLQLLTDRGRPAGAVRSLALPDRFIDHMTPDEMLEEAGLTAGAIAEAAFGMVAARAGGEGREEGRAGTDAA